jgi:hypothetical protein
MRSRYLIELQMAERSVAIGDRVLRAAANALRVTGNRFLKASSVYEHVAFSLLLVESCFVLRLAKALPLGFLSLFRWFLCDL